MLSVNRKVPYFLPKISEEKFSRNLHLKQFRELSTHSRVEKTLQLASCRVDKLTQLASFTPTRELCVPLLLRFIKSLRSLLEPDFGKIDLRKSGITVPDFTRNRGYM